MMGLKIVDHLMWFFQFVLVILSGFYPKGAPIFVMLSFFCGAMSALTWDLYKDDT
jgi:hypothetical protein